MSFLKKQMLGIWKTLLLPADESGLFPIIARISVYGFLLFGILFILASNFDDDELLVIVSFTSIVTVIETMWRKGSNNKKIIWHLASLLLLVGFLGLLLNQAIKVRESWYRTHVLEERIEVLIATAPTAVIVSDGLGYIKHINKYATELVGWTNEELKNKPLSILIRPQKLSAHNIAFRAEAKKLKEGNVVWAYEGDHVFRILRKDGSLAKIQVYILGIRYSSDEKFGEQPPGKDIEFYAIMQPVKPIIDPEYTPE